MRRLLLLAALVLPSVAVAEKPNIVLIMTDNHGAWTLGCYGNSDIKTPNIDRLAEEGTLFTRAFSSNAVCSPTRATYLTGLMPSQHGVHRFLGGNAMHGDEAYNTIEEFRSLSEILADAGYACGISGKWHLGDTRNPHGGFTTWHVKWSGSTRRFYNARVVEDGERRRVEQYLTDYWTRHGVDFIEEHQDEPFFLYLPYNGPYGLSPHLLEPARNAFADDYKNARFPSFPRARMHPWLHNNKNYLNNRKAMRRYAAELSGVDKGVGTILSTLKRLGLEKETLVVFCADQGWLGGQHGIWGMGDHTRPLSSFDGMMRVPLIFRHPGKIPAGERVDPMVSNYDLLPTLLGYLGMADEMPDDPPSPGRDYSPVLRGERMKGWDNVVYYEMENVRTIRTAKWKYIHRYPDGPHELYHLRKDPHEKVNLYGQPKHRDKQKALRKRLRRFFDRYAEPKYDLYEGGKSKTPLLVMPNDLYTP